MNRATPFHPSWLHASGERVFPAGGFSTPIVYDRLGLIKLRREAVVKGYDSNLHRILKAAVDDLKIQVYIYSADGGRHAVNSRHYSGRAVDIALIGRPGAVWDKVTVVHPLALKLHAWLMERGWRVGEMVRGRAVPGVILGPVGHPLNPAKSDHSSHMHVSILLPKKG